MTVEMMIRHIMEMSSRSIVWDATTMCREMKRRFNKNIPRDTVRRTLNLLTLDRVGLAPWIKKIGEGQWKYCPPESDITKFFYDTEHLVDATTDELIVELKTRHPYAKIVF